jgi:hypothetical protein
MKWNHRCIVGGQKTPETIVSDRKPSRFFIGLAGNNLRGNHAGPVETPSLEDFEQRAAAKINRPVREMVAESTPMIRVPPGTFAQTKN